MKANTFSLGGIALLDKAEKDFGLISGIFDGVSKKAKNFRGRVKALLYNRLTHAVSVHQVLSTYPRECFEQLGMKQKPSERALYRAVEQVEGDATPSYWPGTRTSSKDTASWTRTS